MSLPGDAPLVFMHLTSHRPQAYWPLPSQGPEEPAPEAAQESQGADLRKPQTPEALTSHQSKTSLLLQGGQRGGQRRPRLCNGLGPKRSSHPSPFLPSPCSAIPGSCHPLSSLSPVCPSRSPWAVAAWYARGTLPVPICEGLFLTSLSLRGLWGGDGGRKGEPSTQHLPN